MTTKIQVTQIQSSSPASLFVPTYTEYYSNTTWVKPEGASHLRVIVVGGGGGGGAGQRQPTTNPNRTGGAGGAGGAWVERYMPAPSVGATESIVVGLGGDGAVSTTVDSTPGTAGNIGGDSRFGNWVTSGTAGGGPGNASLGNNPASAISWKGVNQPSSTGAGYNAGFGGSSSSPTNTGNYGANTLFGGAGGGGGAAKAVTVTNDTVGGNGGFSKIIGLTGAIANGGNVNAPWGINGQDGIDAGSGGGGGGYRTAQNTGNGGKGALPGGGGGGGSGADNGFNSGAGGRGANGTVYVWVF